eukprot:NODE_851_length_3543_cov_0.476771.p5 type:complete len:102 gc:universal NODE_851_length_3543_cov_0.476771:923-618(-)
MDRKKRNGRFICNHKYPNTNIKCKFAINLLLKPDKNGQEEWQWSPKQFIEHTFSLHNHELPQSNIIIRLKDLIRISHIAFKHVVTLKKAFIKLSGKHSSWI